MNPSSTRRRFLSTSALTGAGLTLAPHLFAQVAGNSPKIKVGLIGCGGRGTGALGDFLEACKILKLDAEVVAVGDAYADRAEPAGKSHKVAPDHVFVGFDAYKKVIATDCNFVLMATPPAFRPVHFAAAVAAGKHCFIEKPVAVDPPGARSIMETGKMAASKGLSVVAGTQRRHQLPYLVNKAMIDAGAIGEIRGGAVYWDGTVPWTHHRGNNESDLDYLVRNWVNFTGMSGDHIVEQHVHQLDVCCWFLGRTPIAAIGYGGRARRPSGDQFDFFSIDYDFGDDVHIHSQCRQIDGTYQRISELFTGATGFAPGAGKVNGKKVEIPEIKVDHDNPYIQEHVDMLRGFLQGKPLNEAQAVADATLVGIMGRISAYTGQFIRWTDLTKNEKSEFYNFACQPGPLEFETGKISVMPKEEPAIPGKA